MVLLAQIGELNAVEESITRIADLGLYGVVGGLLIVIVFVTFSVFLIQRNFGKLNASLATTNDRIVEALTGLIGSMSARLEQAQDTKGALASVVENQDILIKEQSEQAKILNTFPELIGLVNEALTVLRETVVQAKQVAVETSLQTAEGFGEVGRRFDSVDMKNGEILAELKKLNATLQTWIDRQSIDDISQAKEQRRINEEILATLKSIQVAVEQQYMSPSTGQQDSKS
jgi:hypothetical protein